MINKRKSGRTLDNIGKRWYEFDFQSEKNIYCYLCCDDTRRKKIKKLDGKLEFVSYSQWKQYICNKYENYNKDDLMEFSRYLNQRIRNIKPGREYLNIILPCFIPSISTIVYEWIIEPDLKISIQSGLNAVIYGVLITMSLIFSMCSIAKKVFSPILENNIDANLLKDYKEIIDEIISKK